MSVAAPRIAVIGGGITGAFTSFFLSRQGARPVLIERDQIAGAASGNNAGGLNPIHGPGIPGPASALALESLRLHLANWPQVRRLSGIGFRGRFVRRIYVALEPHEAATLAARASRYNAAEGLSARWLSRAELQELEPAVTRDAVGGLLTEGNARVDPSSYTRAVVAAAVALGARTVSAQARGLVRDGDRVTAVELDRGAVDCDGIVIAGGPWSGEPAGWLGLPLAVEPLKGELLLARLERGEPPFELAWRTVGVFHAEGDRVWLGGVEDRAGFDRAPSADARQRILAGIERLLPDLGGVEVIDHVAGLRPVTADGLPVVGLAPEVRNACVATGAGPKGMLLGAALGLAASELVTRGASRLPIAPWGISRRSD